jgi:acyl-CoA synthetase (AMP-forming)/AMP-acid ligase II
MSDTVVDRIRSRADRFADRVAIVEGAATWTYAELFARTDRLASALESLGLRRGDALLAYLPNVHEAVECELAVLGSGLTWITLTARLTWAEVRGVLASCAPKVVVTDTDGLRRIRAGQAALPLVPLPLFVVTGADAETAPSSGSRSYEALLAENPPRATRPPFSLEEPARLRYTSGTTGSAKAAVLPHRVYVASLEALLQELGPFSEADVALHVAPLTHGSGALLHPVLYSGGTNVLVGQFDVEDVLSLIERHRVTTMFTVPTILSRLVSAPIFDRYDVSSLRALVYGGAPMPEARLEAAVAKIGRALYQIYGMTEAPWPIAVLKPADHVAGSPRLRSVGRAAKGVTVRIVDAERRALPDGQVGEIEVRGENVMSGYLADEVETRAVLRDGALATGDLGRFDDEGYLFIVGREKDVIISGGFNVYAAEVEAALSAHEGVLEAAVVGLPHDDWGEMVCAFVVPKEGATLTVADVDALARSRLSGYKCPRRIEIVADLPKNATGKIQKSEIVLRATRLFR